MRLTKFVTLCLLLTTAQLSYAGNEGGGGDASEVRVNEIRSDISKWIKSGGAAALNLPKSISYENYLSKMNEILLPQKVIIGFVENDDETNEELSVKVAGNPKTCRGFISNIDSEPHILCHISRFQKTSESEQYKLIHHEYAGLVGVEKNNGAASDYEISSQITDFLVPEVVLRLAVRPAADSLANLRFQNRANQCSTVYIMFFDDKNKDLKAAALKLKSSLENEPNGPFKVEFIHDFFVPHLKNTNSDIKANSMILELQIVSDISGDPIGVNLYKSNAQNEIIFLGGKVEHVTFFKAKKLVELASRALDFTCAYRSGI